MKSHDKVIQLSQPSVGEDELSSIQSVFASNYLGMGEVVNTFELCLSKMFSRKTICVSSGTAAIQLALHAIGIKKGDEILVQSLTYAATYQAIAALGAIPISCDVNEHDLSIDLYDAENKISNKTKAIIPVHYAGSTSNIENVINFANKNKLRVVEDAAHAFGSKSNNKLIGSFGDITCFSFDPLKTITCGDGGAVITDDESIIDKIKEARFIGIQQSTDSNGNHKKHIVNNIGWRYHMNNINASIGISQLKRFTKLKEARQNVAKRYHQKLSELAKIDLLPYDYNKIAPYIFVIKLNTISNIEMITKLKAKGIIAGFHYMPCHEQPFFKSLYKCNLPKTEKLKNQLISLPLHTKLRIDEIDFVCDSVSKIINYEGK